jgi:transcription initiation factor TFIIF subunit beta
MRERNRKANTPARQVMMIEQAKIPGGKGGINRLSAGVGMGAGRAFQDVIVRIRLPSPLSPFLPLYGCRSDFDFSPMSQQKAKQKSKAPFERMARMPRNQLLDHLFSSFRDQPRWAIKVLREKTQQPEAYLKEVLSDIAFLHRSGEHNGFWELKANYKDDSVCGFVVFMRVWLGELTI